MTETAGVLIGIVTIDDVLDALRTLSLGQAGVTGDGLANRLFGGEGNDALLGGAAAALLFEAMILITELTFVAHSHRKEKIHKFGHMHLDDLLARRILVLERHLHDFRQRVQPRDAVVDHEDREAARPKNAP